MGLEPGVVLTDFGINSAAFDFEGLIPGRYAAEGDNVSPPLTWDKAPQGTKSFALIMEDPDAPGGTFIHWILFNIPAELTSIGEEFPKISKLPNGSMQGLNSFGQIGYDGPQPPKGETHRYFIKLYALDTVLPENPDITADDFWRLIGEHIIGGGQTMGIYETVLCNR